MKFTKPKLTKEETENSTLLAGNFNTTLSATDRNLVQINEVTELLVSDECCQSP